MTEETQMAPNALDAVYTERAHLVALAVHHYNGVYQEDPETPGWALVYADTPAGQVSWHIAPEDRHLIAGLRFAPDVQYDGHTTAEKYARIRSLIGVG